MEPDGAGPRHSDPGQTRTLSKFYAAETEAFQQCLNMEMSVVGRDVRKIQGLPELAWETDLGKEF